MSMRHLASQSLRFAALALSCLVLSACQAHGPRPVTSELGPTAAQGSRAAEIERILAVLDFQPDGALIRPHVDPWQAPSRLAAVPHDTSLLGRAHHALRYGQQREALRFAVAACWHHPDDAAPWTLLGRLLRYQGKFGPAVSALRRARQAPSIDLMGQSHDSLLIESEIARTFDMAGAQDDAMDAWRRVLALDSRHAVAQRRLAALHLLNGDAAAARSLARRLHDDGLPMAAQLQGLVRPQRPAFAPVHQRPASEGIAAPVRIDTGGSTQAAEVHITAAANGELLAAWNDLRATNGVDAWSLGVGTSSDGGQTWTDALVRAPGNNGDDYEGDPMTVYDPRTGNSWVGGVTFFPNRNVYVARKPPAGDLLPPVILAGDMVFDKGLLAAGPRPGQPNSTQLYAAYNLGLQTSSDLGTSWSAILPLEFGVSHHPRVGPDGTVYIAFWDFDDQIILQRSFDGGVTVDSPRTVATRLDVWDAQDGSRFPGRFRVAPIAYLAIDAADGTLYCVYFDTTSVDVVQRNVDIYFTRSTDQGLTWSLPRVINGDSNPPADQFFPWLEVDTSGTLHLAYVDTRHTAQVDDQEEGFFDVYYSTSRDRGDTWSEVRISPDSFSSGAATWPGFEQFLGDFISLTPDPDPASDVAWVAYPATYDGDLDIYVQRVSGGPQLFSDGFESGDLTRWSNSQP